MMDLFGSPDDFEDDDDDDVAAPAIPEDDSDTFGHPRLSKFVTGHENVEKKLLELYNSGRMPHGLVFSGPKGIGKASMAYRIARFLFKNGIKDNQDSLFGAPEPVTTLEIPPTDPVFSRVASGGHADLLTIERLYDEGKDKYKNAVEVDEVRKVAPFLRRTASEGGWRIVIVDDADTMNRNAQNALLKILEEPPQNALLILITHRAGALIPTIKSRTQTIHFDALSSEIFKDLIERQGERLGNEEFAMLGELAQGSFGRAVDIVEAEGLQVAGKVLDLLENYPDYNSVLVHKFADSHANTENGFELFTEIMKFIFRGLARSKARGIDPTGFGVHKQLIQKLASRLTLQQTLAIGDALEAHFQKVQTGNLDRRQGALTAFSLIS